MGRKNAHTWKPFDAVSAATDQTSDATDVQYADNIGFVVTWTGSPVGELFVDVSNDKEAEPTNWSPLDFGSDILIPGSDTSHTINLQFLPYSKIRVRYIRTSGTGTLTVAMTTKQAGG
jgi:hypothetical protein